MADNLITQEQADKIDSIDTVAQSVGLGQKILDSAENSLHFIEIPVDEDISVGGLEVSVPYSFQYVHSVINASVSATSNAVTISNKIVGGATNALATHSLNGVDDQEVPIAADYTYRAFVKESNNVLITSADSTFRATVTLIVKRT